MELFSQRKGLKSIKNSIQTDSVDQALRSRLWNVVHTKLLGSIRMAITIPSPALGEFIHTLWDTYFKLPVDTIPLMGMEVYTRIKSYFFDCEWFEIYDFLEFIDTSDADGIRHALLDESKLGYDEAKFMLVSCSAFVNYLLSKTSEAGIQHPRY